MSEDDEDASEFIYEITVWNMEGDVVKKLWQATEGDLDEIEEQYGDDPFYTIQVERND